jgi:hypothetical protein
VQDIFTNIGARKHTLQITADIFNFGNMLNKNWGVRQIWNAPGSGNISQPLRFMGYNTAGQPTFNLAQQVGQLVNKPWQDNFSLASTWSMQLGLRYIF